MHGGALKGFFDFDAWAEWIHSLDTAWLFVLILALVVAVVVRWSTSLQPDITREPEED
jgi:heme A synthase